MKTLTVMRTEFLKQKRGFLWKMALLFPILDAALVFFDVYLRKDYLIGRYGQRGIETLWEILVYENHYSAVWFLFLAMGVVVTIGVLYNIEEESGGWKYSLSLPVKRTQIYLAKWLTGFLLAAAVILVNVAGLLLAGKLLGGMAPFPVAFLARYVLLQIGAVVGIISFQMFLNTLFHNIIIPLSLGFGAVITSLFILGSGFEKYTPYIYTYAVIPECQKGLPAYGPLVIGVIFLALGAMKFSKKEML